jgi:glyoxylase-like metal-dependent hydrolase (beta-lactamase superfamily II)
LLTTKRLSCPAQAENHLNSGVKDALETNRRKPVPRRPANRRIQESNRQLHPQGKTNNHRRNGATSSIPNLISGLEEAKVKLEDVAYVAVSHIHLDQGGGVGTLLKSLANAKVIVHRRGAPHLIDSGKLWRQSQLTLGSLAKIFGAPEPVPNERILTAVDGMEIDVGDCLKLRVLETLGHASHHLSYHLPAYSGVFPGDAAGIFVKEFQAVAPTSPPPFRLDFALASLEKLVALKPKILFYTHFGEAGDAVERLRGYAQQLRL